MANMNTRLNIEKLDGNIVQKHGGSKQVGLKQLGSKQVGFKQLGVKQVGFKQLGHSVETGVHIIHDEKLVWFEVELQGVQGDRKAEVFQVSNDDTAVRSTQQCTKSEVAKHLSVAVIQQQNGLVKEMNVTLLAKVHCFLIQSGLSKVFWAEDTTMSTYLVNRNMGFNESEEYKKTFIGSGVSTGSMQVLHGFEFEVEPLGDHTFEVEPQENVDQGAGWNER
nr:retrovirus-related Pol polyprotein from transposon TNT 1-94 [Tanacetum cinerariifolium]